MKAHELDCSTVCRPAMTPLKPWSFFYSLLNMLLVFEIIKSWKVETCVGETWYLNVSWHLKWVQTDWQDDIEMYKGAYDPRIKGKHCVNTRLYYGWMQMLLKRWRDYGAQGVGGSVWDYPCVTCHDLGPPTEAVFSLNQLVPTLTFCLLEGKHIL